MGKEAIEGLVTVATAIVVIAIIAVIVSQRSDTAKVLGAGGKALSDAISAAVSPVTSNAKSAASTQVGQQGTVLDQMGRIFPD